MRSFYMSAASAATACGLVVAFGTLIVCGGDARAMPDPVAHWKLDEIAGDKAVDSAGGNDGTLGNMTLPAASVAGKVDTAFVFDGSDDHVNCGNPSFCATLAEYTIMAWVKPDDSSTNGYGDPIIAKEGGGYGFQLVWHQDSKFGLMTKTASGVEMLWTASDKANGTWYHVAASWTASDGTARIYVDGELEVEGSRTYSPNSTDTLCIAHFRPTSDTRPLAATIDDVRIYDVALSEAEIRQIKLGAEVTIMATDPVAGEPSDTGTFTVYRTGPTTADLDVTLLIEGTAVRGSGGDYTLDIAANTVTIPAGAASQMITVTPVDDENQEPAKEIIITIVPEATYAVGAENQDRMDFLDDDTKPLAFNLTRPLDGAENVTVTPMLWWQAAARADTYKVVVCADASMTVVVHEHAGIMGTTYTVPAATLDYDTVYYWQVTAHNAIGDTTSTGPPWMFNPSKMGPPAVTRTDPDHDDSGVDISAGIKVYFSEAMVAATETAISVADAAGGDVPGSATLSGLDTVLTFVPEEDLDYKATYTVTIDATTATDKAAGANPLDATNSPVPAGSHYAFTFTTFEELTGLATGEGCVPAAGCGAAWLVTAIAAVVAGRVNLGRRLSRRAGRRP